MSSGPEDSAMVAAGRGAVRSQVRDDRHPERCRSGGYASARFRGTADTPRYSRLRVTVPLVLLALAFCLALPMCGVVLGCST